MYSKIINNIKYLNNINNNNYSKYHNYTTYGSNLKPCSRNCIKITKNTPWNKCSCNK